MSELRQVARILGGKYPACIQQFNGNFFVVGSVPRACYDFDAGRSRIYTSEADAIAAVIAAGAARIQRCDCSFVEGYE